MFDIFFDFGMGAFYMKNFKILNLTFSSSSLVINYVKLTFLFDSKIGRKKIPLKKAPTF